VTNCLCKFGEERREGLEKNEEVSGRNRVRWKRDDFE